MTYKTYNCNTFNVYTIKTDKFKTCHMEILFSKKINKETIYEDNFLTDILTENTKKYSTKDLEIRLEDLYRTVLYSVVSKTGNMLNSSFVLDFINPEYIDEEDYLENVLKLPFEALENPNVCNSEWDLKTFNILKDKIIKEIKAIEENSLKISIRHALKAMDKDSITSISSLGTLEDIEKITPATLYKRYQAFFKEHACNIFIIGNLDMDKVVSIIRKYYHNRIISDTKINIEYTNKLKKRVTKVVEDSNFIQSNLIMIYNLDNLTKFEKDTVFNVFNYILGSGGLTSKLYEALREKNSLCYSLFSNYLKNDNLLVIGVSLDKANVKKAISLIKKCLKEMIHGDFSEEMITDAKTNLCLSYDLTMDNNMALINNYVFEVLNDLPPIPERREALKKVSKEDLMNVAKKLKLNTIYVLNGGNK